MYRRLTTWLVIFFIGLGFTISAAAAEYSKQEIINLTNYLALQREMPPEKTRWLINALKASYDDPWFKAQIKKQPVRGVFVYSSGEGGFVVKYMKGDGLASFKNGRQKGTIFLSSWSAGAIIGGAATWALGLVMGLQKESDFGGDYTGKLLQATAADETAPKAMHLTSQKEGKATHELYILVSSRGLTADAGGTKLNITPNW
ncbi:MAG: hypothetical protein WBM69_07430 [Desulfobacterales bacterium]